MSRWGRIRILAVAVLALTVAGCGATATPLPTPTATSTPAPTANPSGVTAEFLAQLLLAKTGVVDVAGTMTALGNEFPISGSITLAGSDTHAVMSIAIAGTPQTTETIRVGTAEWTRMNEGPWVANPDPADQSTSLPSFFETLKQLEDRGVETKAGRELHHLVPPASVTLSPEAIGISDPAILANATVEMEFWAEADGTPAFWSIAVAWSQATGGTTVDFQMAMDLDLAGLGGTAVVEAPEDAWERYTSTRFGYSMAHPPGWTVEEREEGDSYLVEGTPFVTVAPQSVPGYTLERFKAELVDNYRAQLKTTPDSEREMTIGGQPGWFLTYHFENADGDQVYVADGLTVAGDTGWEIFLTELAGVEAQDTPVFEDMLSTATFTK